MYKYLLMHNGEIKLWRDEKIIESRIESDESDKYLTFYDELVFWTRFGLRIEEEISTAEFNVTKIWTVYDKNLEQPVYIEGDRVYPEHEERYVLVTEYQGRYLCTEEQNIYLLNEDGIYNQTKIEDSERIKFGFKRGEEIYLIAEKEKQDSIYQLNLESFEVKLLKEVDKSEKVVAMTEAGFICVNSQSILIRDIQTGEIIGEQKWENKINLDSDTVEMAGDYVFVYGYEQGIMLKEKQKLDWE